MPPKKATSPDSVYIITCSHLDAVSKTYGTSEILQVHSSLDSANVAAKELTDDLTDGYQDPVTNEGENQTGGYKFHCHAGQDKNEGCDLEVSRWPVLSGGAAKKAAKEKAAKAYDRDNSPLLMTAANLLQAPQVKAQGRCA